MKRKLLLNRTVENVDNDDGDPPQKKMLLEDVDVHPPPPNDIEIEKMKDAHQQKVSQLKKKLKVSQQKARRQKRDGHQKTCFMGWQEISWIC